LKNKIIKLLNTVDREGMDKLIDFMEKRNFFTQPGSTKYHSSYNGGLMEHSVKVYNLFNKFINMSKTFTLPQESIIICGILHDLCKANRYIGNRAPYKFNFRYNGKGHATHSIERIERFIKLTDDEKDIITYHMGIYGTNEFNQKTGEYTFSELVEIWSRKKLVKIFYFCDDVCTQLFERREKNGNV